MTSASSPIRILDRPMRFYRARMGMPPSWRLAFSPLILVVALQVMAGALIGSRMQPQIDAALADVGAPVGPVPTSVLAAMTMIAGAAGYAAMFGANALVVVFLDLLFAQSGQVRRLAEFVGYSLISQVPLAIAGLGLAIGATPEPLRLPPDATLAELPNIVRDYQETISGSTTQSVLRMIGVYFGIWLAALQAGILRVVSDFSVAGTWAAGVLLAALFVVMPYAVRLLW